MTTQPASTTSDAAGGASCITAAAPSRGRPLPIGRVGFVGLGDQGGAIAEMILRGGFTLDVWARRSTSVEPLVQLGATTQSSAAALGECCDVVGICVVDDAAVTDVVVAGGLLEAMRPGSTLVLHSTLAPVTSRRLAALAAPNGVDVLDAPVSGGRAGALRGALSVIVSGEVAAFERVRPVLATFGNPVRHVGSIGTAHVVKLINNALFVANVEMAREALELGERCGVERALLAELLAASSGRSAGLDALPALTDTDWGRSAWEILTKDVGLAGELLSERGGEPSGLLETARAAIDHQRHQP